MHRSRSEERFALTQDLVTRAETDNPAYIIQPRAERINSRAKLLLGEKVQAVRLAVVEIVQRLGGAQKIYVKNDIPCGARWSTKMESSPPNPYRFSGSIGGRYRHYEFLNAVDGSLQARLDAAPGSDIDIRVSRLQATGPTLAISRWYLEAIFEYLAGTQSDPYQGEIVPMRESFDEIVAAVRSRVQPGYYLLAE